MRNGFWRGKKSGKEAAPVERGKGQIGQDGMGRLKVRQTGRA